MPGLHPLTLRQAVVLPLTRAGTPDGALDRELIERALGGVAGEAWLAELAGEVANRKLDPFTAVNEILKRSGLEH